MIPADKGSAVRPPATVVIVAAFLFLGTLISLVTAVTLLFPRYFSQRIWQLNPPAYLAFERMRGWSGILLLALAVLSASAATGLMLRRRWAWWMAICLFSVNGLEDVVSLFATRDFARGVPGLLVVAAFVFSLSRPSVRGFFLERESSAS